MLLESKQNENISLKLRSEVYQHLESELEKLIKNDRWTGKPYL